MTTITLTRNGKYWQARWTDARGKRRAKGLGPVSKRAATVKVRRMQADMDLGRVTDQQAPRLGDFCDRFLEHHPEYSAGTVEMYQQTIRYLLGFFDPDLRIDRITRSAAADWRAALAAGEFRHLNQRDKGVPNVGTVCRHVREVKKMFNEAADQELIGRNPFAKLQGTPPKPDKTWAYVDLPTFRRLMEVCRNDDWRLLLGLCRLAGLRQGEALRLTWADVDLERRRLTIVNPGTHRSTKKRSRQVPIVRELHDLLFAVWMKGDRGERVVGLRPHADLWRAFGKLCQRIGLERHDRWCHTLRKNCETDWMAEHPAMVVTEWLGHSVQVAMQHYVRAENRDFERAAGVATVEVLAGKGVG